MPYKTIEHDEGQFTVVNTDEITYVRQDIYGTAIHFTSGDHIICTSDLEVVMERLFDKSVDLAINKPVTNESLLLRS